MYQRYYKSKSFTVPIPVTAYAGRDRNTGEKRTDVAVYLFYLYGSGSGTEHSFLTVGPKGPRRPLTGCFPMIKNIIGNGQIRERIIATNANVISFSNQQTNWV
jgi:hypothetical protein